MKDVALAPLRAAGSRAAGNRGRDQRQTSVEAFKGFDANLKCRDFQYEIGATYTHEGAVVACKSGFHSCEMPLDVLSYYRPNTSRFAIVEAKGALSRDGKDSKIASAEITIKAEIKLPDLISRAVAWILAKATGNTATGDSGHAAATGDSGHAAAIGYSGHAAATGDSGHAAATGNYGHAAATGDSGHAAATGYSGHAAATGNSGHAAATGDSGHAAATGDSGHAAATGNYGHAAATGNSGHAAATGYSGHAAATGNYGHAAAIGYSGHAAATGDSGHAAATGAHAVAVALGERGTAKSGPSGALVLARFDHAAGRRRIYVAYVGENGIKPNTNYRIGDAGEFVEVSP